jgi:hypothetical protein
MVFGGRKGSGYEIVLENQWLRLHNWRQDIYNIRNEMSIDEEDGRHHHLVGWESIVQMREVRATDLGLATLTWRKAHEKQHCLLGKMTILPSAGTALTVG